MGAEFTFSSMPMPFLAEVAAAIALVALIIVVYFRLGTSYIYLVDFTCYKPPDHLRVPIGMCFEHLDVSNIFDHESTYFQVKVYERSGIGSESCVPESLHELPPNATLKMTRVETELVLFTVVQDLLSRNNVDPKSIDIIVSNCSIFCPTPSITSLIINRFGFRSNVKSFSLSGMGCSAGLLSISLVKDLLKVHKNSTALVLSMEAVTPNGYHGKVKSMLLSNVLFRMGGAAILLSNKKQDRSRAKYKLQNLVRSHGGANDEAYESVFQRDDEDGLVGVSLSRALLRVAGKTLTTNIMELGPQVLPYLEMIRYACALLRMRFTHPSRLKDGIPVPNFKKAFEHFCIHAGGRAVIDAVEENLRLHKDDGEASRMTLYRFGNTSSSSVWYELSYLEAKGRVKKGDRVWQIAFGSGFKCNSAVWKCILNLDPNTKNAWSDRIHRYPVEVP
ncbi:hypothetical protein SAY87_000159 [Trapa incisa]|uniref:3-ketoacyl-CoA synthase n=1 Tax=Trapa incisa TaxID=236973 RepID=A0AAN7GLU8_9MYRT|nr:hypothetical protein SAY87_000159 [Trapa incisa]